MFTPRPLPVDVVSGVARVRTTSTIAGSTATRVLGLDRVGILRAGLDANLVVLDQDLQVTAVMANGRWRVGC